MKIYLVQHGEALAPEIDPERSLSPEGKKELEKLGEFLGKHSFPLTTILHSHKARARQTAEIFQRFVAPQTPLEQYAHMAPNDPIQPILDRIEDGVMFVGHLPFLQKLSGFLIAHDENAIVIKFSYGKVICLEKIDSRFALDWAIGTNLVS